MAGHMRILFIGDIVGRAGRELVKKGLKGLVAQHDIDLVIANAENAYLLRTHPSGQIARVVLNEDRQKSFDRSEQRSVNHDGTVSSIVIGDVRRFETLRQLKVKLDS